MTATANSIVPPNAGESAIDIETNDSWRSECGVGDVADRHCGTVTTAASEPGPPFRGTGPAGRASPQTAFRTCDSPQTAG